MAGTPDRPGNRDAAQAAAPWPADETADCEGLLCPLPVLRARKRMAAMAPGAVLCLRATDAMARIDLPHWCAEAGHDYLGAIDEGRVTLHFLRRGADGPPDPAAP